MSKQKNKLVKKNSAFPNFHANSHPHLYRFHENLFKHSKISLDIDIPISIFDNGSLSSLETISKYIKEELGFSFREISYILNRNERTIWGAYQSAKRKMQTKLPGKKSLLFIPIAIINDRALSVLESITEYLRDTQNLRYCKIAALLNRDDRTIWTVYKRAKRKRANNENIAG
jgi:hypothetical protein